MATQPRREYAAIEVALVVAVLVCGVLAVIEGLPWLIIVAGLGLLGVLVLDQLIGPNPGSAIDTRQLVVVVAVVLVLVIAGYVAVGKIATSPSSPRRAGPLVLPSATSSAAPGSGGGARPAATPATTSVPASVPRSATASSPRPSSSPGPVSSSGPSGVAWYVTAGAGVNLRAEATTSSVIVATMAAFATPLALSCFQAGEAVHSSPYWYRAEYDGQVGYVSELWIDAGADPSRTGLPHC